MIVDLEVVRFLSDIYVCWADNSRKFSLSIYSKFTLPSTTHHWIFSLHNMNDKRETIASRLSSSYYSSPGHAISKAIQCQIMAPKSPIPDSQSPCLTRSLVPPLRHMAPSTSRSVFVTPALHSLFQVRSSV